MVLEAIKNALKLAMATLALLIVSNQFSNQFILLGVCFVVCGLALGTIKTIEKRPKPLQLGPNGEYPEFPDNPNSFGREGNVQLTEQQQLVEMFVNRVMEHCYDQNENCTLMNQPDGLWVVRVNDETGEVDKVCNLSIPSEKDVTRENIEGIITRTIEDIDVKLKQFKE